MQSMDSQVQVLNSKLFINIVWYNRNIETKHINIFERIKL